MNGEDYKKEAGVYILTNKINGKVYVGEGININKRIRYYTNGYTCNKSRERIIDKAILKYGIENFNIEVEYFPNFTKDELLFLEAELIKKFDCLAPKGYNVCNYGTNRLGIKLPESSKINMRKPKSEETKRKISESKKGRPAHNRGLLMTEGQKDRISTSKTGKPNIQSRGEKHHNSKLKDSDIIDIKRLYFEDGVAQHKIAKFYSVGPDHISRIVNGKVRQYLN